MTKNTTMRAIIPAQPGWSVAIYREDKDQIMKSMSDPVLPDPGYFQVRPVIAWHVAVQPDGKWSTVTPITVLGEPLDGEIWLLKTPDGEFIRDPFTAFDNEEVALHVCGGEVDRRAEAALAVYQR
jgi:hypothetical protein